MKKITPEPKNKLEEKPIATGQIYIDNDGRYLRVNKIDDDGDIHLEIRWSDDGGATWYFTTR